MIGQVAGAVVGTYLLYQQTNKGGNGSNRIGLHMLIPDVVKEQLWRSAHPSRHFPVNIVEKVRTNLPSIVNGSYVEDGGVTASMKGISSLAGDIFGNANAGRIVAAHMSVEIQDGDLHNTTCNKNTSNRKYTEGDYNANRAAYDLTDNDNVYDFYPCFDTYEDCINDYMSLITRRYQQAYSALMAGDIVGFCVGLGAGGYATSYGQNPNLIKGRANRLIHLGLLEGPAF